MLEYIYYLGIFLSNFHCSAASEEIGTLASGNCFKRLNISFVFTFSFQHLKPD